MESLFNYIAGAIGIVASLISIYQFLLRCDKSRQIQELEKRNSYLSGKVVDLLAGAATDVAESKEALDHDRPRLQFKHLAHSYDRLRRRVVWGITAFSGISYVIVLSIVGGDYGIAFVGHVLAIPLAGLPTYFITRHIALRKLRDLYAEASYQGDNDMTELQGWISTQPWRQKSTAPTLNKAVMKWSSSG